jgi:type VI secretion system secreted protein Hcp
MILVNIPGIEGLTEVKDHEKWVPVESFKWSVGRTVDNSVKGNASENVSSPGISAVTFTRSTDKASPNLYYESSGGKLIKETTIEVVQIVGNKPQTHVKITLGGVHVSSYEVSSNGDNPTESFTLNFTTLKFQYNTYKNGVMSEGMPREYDFKKNFGK